MYQFETHYGQSVLTDEETGLSISWTNGDYNNTQKASFDQATLALIIPDGEDTAAFLARKMREMSEHIAAEYPELV